MTYVPHCTTPRRVTRIVDAYRWLSNVHSTVLIAFGEGLFEKATASL